MDHVQHIKDIIFKYLPADKYNVFLFGSRASESHRKWSDFDIGVKGDSKIPQITLSKIEGELEESDIPYKVDVVDFSRVSGKFR